jgi:hypoxanthine phosphoribosyltransferase
MATVKRLTWQAVLKLSDLLANKIVDSGTEFDMLVGLARGGLIPSRLLSDRLNVKKVASIGISYEGSGRTNPMVYSLPSPVKKGQKILLIEDRIESGKSLKKAMEILDSQGAVTHTACYFSSNSSVLRPDYYLHETDDDIIFPWE